MKPPRETAEELLASADRVLAELAGLEAGDHEVFASHETELRAVYENDDFSVTASHASASYGVRSIVGGRLGFATTNSSRPEALRRVAREAQDVACLSLPSEHHGIVRNAETTAHEELCDPTVLALGPEDIYGLLGEVVAEARRDPRVVIERAELTWSVETDVLVNSAGRRGSSSYASCAWVGMGMARTPHEVTSFDYDGSHATRHEHLAPRIQASMSVLRDSVVGSLGARKGETYRGAVLLHPYAVLDLVASLVEDNCNGLAHVDDVSPWKGLLGERVACDLLSVFENPRDPESAEWAPFDREGMPTARHPLLDAGRLRFIAHNTFTAHRAGVAPTGNAAGDAQALPRIGFHNLSVEPAAGDARVMSEDALLRALGRGLVVKRFSGNADTLSGHFSGTAKNSWWVRGGAHAGPVSEVMIAGNLFEVLESIVAAGDRMHSQFGAGRAPYLLVDGVSVTAG